VDFGVLVEEKDELVARLRQAKYADVAGRARGADRGSCPVPRSWRIRQTLAKINGISP
jgi:hypothetical protein